MHEAALPQLHRFDQCIQKSSFVNLPVLWWKAIAGNRRGSPAADGGMAWDLLPPITRWIVGWPLCWLYPALHHQNVAIRTVFLDRALNETLSLMEGSTAVVVLGAGFDSRSLRLLPERARGEGKRGQDLTFFELDLPEVVDQKQRVLDQRVYRRRPSLAASDRHPRLIAADLNSNTSLDHALREALGSCCARQVVFLCEAVLLYLRPPGRSVEVLQQCLAAGQAAPGVERVAFVFADRLPAVAEKDRGVPLGFDENVTSSGRCHEYGSVTGIGPHAGGNTASRDAPDRRGGFGRTEGGGTGLSAGPRHAATEAAPWASAHCEEERARRFWASLSPGLVLTQWQQKPGLACHMGVAVDHHKWGSEGEVPPV